MTETAIQVQEISKRYRIGLKDEIHDTFAGAMGDWFRRPVKNLRRLRRLSRFADEESEDVIWALKDVSFQVKPGEVVGVIGRNGAGKSTLLKILSRITHPTSGRVELNGRVSSLLEVGTGFHPELTGRENIYLNGTILGMTRREIDRKFDEIVDFSGVEKFIDTPVKRYSSGMRVRLAFSVAAHLEPEILLVDEVLAVGDVEFQKKCIGKMGEVAQAGRTVLFVSHNMTAISSLTDRAIWVEDGKIQQDGATNTVIEAYLSNFDDLPFGSVDLRSSSNYIQHISFHQNDEPVSTIKIGEPLTIRIEYETDFDLFKPTLGLGIDHPQAGRLLSLSTRLVKIPDLPAQVRSGAFICDVRSWPLNQGTYTVTIVLSDGLKDLERIEQACQVKVVQSDFFGSGVVPTFNQSKFIADHKWRYEP